MITIFAVLVFLGSSNYVFKKAFIPEERAWPDLKTADKVQYEILIDAYKIKHENSEEVEIVAADGVRLLGNYYERKKVNAPYQVPYKLKAASAALLYCFFGFLTTSGNFSDHGSRSSKNDRSLSSMCLGISVRRCSKYSYGFRLFAFAVSAML